MSEEGPKLTDSRVRANLLRNKLRKIFSKKKSNQIIRLIQESTKEKVGNRPSINILNASEVEDILQRLWKEGIFGIADSELLKIDNFLTKQRLKKLAMLRFFKYYVEAEEYRGIETAIQLAELIKNQYPYINDRTKMIKGLYKKIEGYRYGKKILNQVSRGWLVKITYSEMREMETRLTSGGRVKGNEKEMVSQIFYTSLKSSREKLWVNREDDVLDVFERIIDRFGEEDPEKFIITLNVYSARSARKTAKEATDLFVEINPEFLKKEFKQEDDPASIRIRIKRK